MMAAKIDFVYALAKSRGKHDESMKKWEKWAKFSFQK